MLFLVNSIRAEPNLASEPIYLGVGSCASSNCHGNATAKTGINIHGNEYITWKRHDSHSKAWSVLTNSDSKIIGKHLGINNPEKDQTCLSCHSTNAPEAKIGEQYKNEDGVGCESCHGPASNWIKSHTEKNTKHATNIVNGMFDITDATKRSTICLNCHLGSNDQIMTHKLIGAGHPRLTFELDTFSQVLPAHWKIDNDYIERKGNYAPLKFWLVGQVTRSIRFLELFIKSSNKNQPVDFSFSYCYSCHHSLIEDQWKKNNYHGTPGNLKLNLASLIITKEAFKILDPRIAEILNEGISNLNKGSIFDTDQNTVKELFNFLQEKCLKKAETSNFSSNHLINLRKQFIEYGIKSATSHYEEAEQILMALSAISAQEGKNPSKEYTLLYKVLKNEENYNAQKFLDGLKLLQKLDN